MAGGRAWTVRRRLRIALSWIACQVRPRIPWVVARRLVRWAVARDQGNLHVLVPARDRMDELTGGTLSPTELDRVAREHVEFDRRFRELRWHPTQIDHQHVEGLEHLVEARSRGRGVVLSFSHHGHFDGAFASVARHGVPIKAVAGAAVLESSDPNMAQHLRVVARGAEILPVGGGSAALVAELRRGNVVALAPDIPGHSEAMLAGRRVRCSSGVARVAFEADATVVVMTSHRDGDRSWLRLDGPLEPRDHADVDDLLAALIRRHAQAVLDWPAAQFLPHYCWTTADD